MVEVKKLIRDVCEEILQNSISEKKIKKISGKHIKKIHFIPMKYRVLGGILQSMNIQWGNFLEKVITKCVELDNTNTIFVEYSGKKRNKFELSGRISAEIDKYLTMCKVTNQSEEMIREKFLKLTKIIDVLAENDLEDSVEFTHDIDILFERNSKIYYIEVKYNDDHDTGKHEDINRKFIKTYGYIRSKLYRDGIEKELVPILFYFNDKKDKANRYIPEDVAIMRGEAFFEKFTNTDYNEIDKTIEKISEDEETLEMFGKLQDKISDWIVNE